MNEIIAMLEAVRVGEPFDSFQLCDEIQRRVEAELNSGSFSGTSDALAVFERAVNSVLKELAEYR